MSFYSLYIIKKNNPTLFRFNSLWITFFYGDNLNKSLFLSFWLRIYTHLSQNNTQAKRAITIFSADSNQALNTGI